MQDKALYDQLLGLQSPWSVAKVELNAQDQQVGVFTPWRRGFAWHDNLKKLGYARVSQPISWTFKPRALPPEIEKQGEPSAFENTE